MEKKRSNDFPNIDKMITWKSYQLNKKLQYCVPEDIYDAVCKEFKRKDYNEKLA